MRKGIFLMVAMLSFTFLNATNTSKSTSKIGVTSRYNDVVTFVERGIKFQVFLNGEFDFNTHYRNGRYYNINGRRFHNGFRITRDYDGRVRSIGNVNVNYDFRGNVSRIGSVYMDYRFGNLVRVGNLFIDYDRFGNPFFNGNVKGRNYYGPRNGCDVTVNLGTIYDYDNAYFYRRDFRRNYRQFKEDNNFYYYKATPNARIGKHSKVIKRRKSNTRTHKKRNTNPHRSTNKTYLKKEKEDKGKIVKRSRRS